MSRKSTASPRGIQMVLAIANSNAKALAAAGVDPELAREIGIEAANQIRKDYGGEKIYIPKGVEIETRNRHQQIWREFTGDNYLKLAKKYGLTVRHVEKIIARCRKKQGGNL